MNNAIRASEYCDNVFDGTHATPKPTSKGFKLITSKHIMHGELDKGNAYFISEHDYNEINKRSRIKQWDVLFSMIGTVGNVYIEKSEDIDYAIKNLGAFSCKNKDEAKWLYYYLKSPLAQSIINNYLLGAVQKFLPLDALRNFPIPQYNKNCKWIIELLESLDNKVNANQEICSELESMSQDLYHYWFTQFDFPDEKGRPYKSSGGKMVWCEELGREIPKGWKVQKLAEVVTITLGGTPDTKKRAFWENGDISWLNSGEIANFPVLAAEAKITQEAIDNSATLLLRAGSVALSITRYIRPTILGIDACINQSVVGIEETAAHKNSFLYPFICSQVSRYMSLRIGAMQPHINKEIVDETLIVLPSDRVLREYYMIADTIFAKILTTSKESLELARLRDFLLPLLMNGQVQVS